MQEHLKTMITARKR